MQNSFRTKYGLLIAGCLTAFGAPGGAALAQDAGANEGIEEIVVTARKRGESLLEAPITITSFSSNDIEKIGMRDLEDIAAYAPGLYYTEQGNVRGGRYTSVVRFRGMDINDVSPVRQLASVFIDGVYVAGGVTAISTDDVERVEVIKGPQSAYFGRSTFGGAVNFITRDPSTTESAGTVKLRLAEDDDYEVSGSVDIPLIEEKLAARVTGRYYTAGGRWESAADGGRLGEQETTSVGFSVVATPNDNLRVRFRGNYAEDEDGLSPTFALDGSYHNCGPFGAGTVSYICGELPYVGDIPLNTPLTGTPRDVFVNNIFDSPAVAADPVLDHTGMERDALRMSLTADWDIGDTPYTASLLLGYNSIEQRRLNDLDHTGENVWLESNFQDIEDRTLEATLSYEKDRLTWLVGANYFNMEYAAPVGQSIGWLYPQPFLPNGFFFDQAIGENDVTTIGLFGAVSYALTDTVNVSVEARYQEDEIEETAGTVLSETFTNFLPRVILQWQPTDQTNLYFTYAKGNKPGNFNNNVVGLNETQRQQVQEQTGATEFVDEGELDNYEVGIKQSFLDGRAFVSAAVYFMQWSNQQTQTTAVVDDPTSPVGFRTIPVIIVAGETDLWGLELEGNWAISERWSARGTFNWAASEYQVFECQFCARVTGTADMSGNETPRYPEFSGSLGLEYVAPARNGSEWYARADLVYTGSTWTEAFNLAETEAYWTANARVGIDSMDWRFELFVNNVFDEEAYRGAARFTDFTTGTFDLSRFVTTVTPLEPRQFGVQITRRF